MTKVHVNNLKHMTRDLIGRLARSKCFGNCAVCAAERIRASQGTEIIASRIREAIRMEWWGR
jgi:hypothetical protein